jgi:hypothetical protein
MVLNNKKLFNSKSLKYKWQKKQYCDRIFNYHPNITFIETKKRAAARRTETFLLCFFLLNKLRNSIVLY